MPTASSFLGRPVYVDFEGVIWVQELNDEGQLNSFIGVMQVGEAKNGKEVKDSQTKSFKAVIRGQVIEEDSITKLYNEKTCSHDCTLSAIRGDLSGRFSCICNC